MFDSCRSQEIGFRIVPCLILEEKRDSMPVEVFLMFQWLIFLVDIAGNEMPPMPPMPLVVECAYAPPNVECLLRLPLALL